MILKGDAKEDCWTPELKEGRLLRKVSLIDDW